MTAMGWITARQQRRDHAGQRYICAACGHPATDTNPLKVIDGARVHTSHTQDPRSGYYGS